MVVVVSIMCDTCLEVFPARQIVIIDIVTHVLQKENTDSHCS